MKKQKIIVVFISVFMLVISVRQIISSFTRDPIASEIVSVKTEPVRKIDVVLQGPIFGIYLGEPLEDLNNRLGLRFDENNMWVVLTYPEYLTVLMVFSYDYRVCALSASFADITQSNYGAIKQSLIQKYGPPEKNWDGDLVARCSFFPIIDYISVGINLRRNADSIDADRITLMYIHTPLYFEMEQEISQRKSDIIADDL